MPRFYPDNYVQNLELLDELVLLSEKHECTMGQLALAWLLHAGDHVIPIPGTTNLTHLVENFDAPNVELTSQEFKAMGDLINRHTVMGDRYIARTQAEIDTEQFDQP